jgi:hypothetical protein
MKWNNALKDKLPENEQEVLICVDGINHRATYNKSIAGFVDSLNKIIFRANHKLIYWTEYCQPE